jgi:N-acetylneuraminic acid mutarotase
MKVTTNRTKIAARHLWLALIALATQFPTLHAQEASGETWTKKANLPTPRVSLATCVLDGKIYALGGATTGNSGGLRTVEAYDPAANTWAARAAMPTARGWFKCEAVNGKIYTIGGDSIGFLSAPLNTVEEYSPATDSWTRKSDMPTAREGFASEVVAGKIYVIGGLTSRDAPTLSTVEAYDPATDTWERKADMPTARGLLCSSVVDGRIFTIGAGGPFPSLSTVEMYDPQSNTWTRKASMPTPRGASAAVTAHGRIYVMGGRTSEAIFALVQEYDPAANTWTQRTDIWSTNPLISVPLYSFGANEVNGRIYAIGGATGNDRVGLSQVLEYTPPVIAPALKMSGVNNSGQNVFRLEWLSHPDYLDVLQSGNQLQTDGWIEVERFDGTGGTVTKDTPSVQPATFYRLQRTLR